METWVIILIFVIIIIIIIVCILIWYFVYKDNPTDSITVIPPTNPTSPLKYGDNVSINMVNIVTNFNGPLIPCGTKFINLNVCKQNVVVVNSNANSLSNTLKSWKFTSATKSIGTPISYGEDVFITSETGGKLDICGKTDSAICGDNVGISTPPIGVGSLWQIQKIGTTNTSAFVMPNVNLYIHEKNSNKRLSICNYIDSCTVCKDSTSKDCSLNVSLRSDNNSNIWNILNI